MTARSWRTRRATNGRCIFTTTSVPSTSARRMDLGYGRRREGTCSRGLNTSAERPAESLRTAPARRQAKVRAGRWSRHHLNSDDEFGREDPLAR